MNLDEMPIIGLHMDIEKRFLSINKIDLKNRMGREIQGKIKNFGDDYSRDYSCTLQIWQDIWRDRMIRVDPSNMKIG